MDETTAVPEPVEEDPNVTAAAAEHARLKALAAVETVKVRASGPPPDDPSSVPVRPDVPVGELAGMDPHEFLSELDRIVERHVDRIVLELRGFRIPGLELEPPSTPPTLPPQD